MWIGQIILHLHLENNTSEKAHISFVSSSFLAHLHITSETYLC